MNNEDWTNLFGNQPEWNIACSYGVHKFYRKEKGDLKVKICTACDAIYFTTDVEWMMLDPLPLDYVHPFDKQADS